MTRIRGRIVIVAYQSEAFLQRCIDALDGQTDQSFEVVIVDNTCPDDCTRELALPNERFSVKKAPGNLGFSGGSNFGAQGATTNWIITLNPDALPRATWFEELVLAAEQHPNATMLSSTLLQMEDPSKVDGFGDVYSIFGIPWRGAHNSDTAKLPMENVRVLGPCGAAAAYKREAFEKNGGFDEKYFCYLEDVDLAVRLQQSGGVCIQVRRAEVMHFGSGSSKVGCEFRFFQTYQNNLRLIVKNAPALLLPLQLSAYAASQSYIMFRNRKNPGASERWAGLKVAIKSLPDTFKDRRATRKAASAGAFSLAQMIAWTPGQVTGLKPLYRPIDAPSAAGPPRNTSSPSMPVATDTRSANSAGQS